jgi:hypothetical protein
VYPLLLSYKQQVALDVTTTQAKPKESKQRISRSSRSSKNLKIRHATPRQVHVQSLFMLITFLFCAL